MLLNDSSFHDPERVPILCFNVPFPRGMSPTSAFHSQEDKLNRLSLLFMFILLGGGVVNSILINEPFPYLFTFYEPIYLH